MSGFYREIPIPKPHVVLSDPAGQTCQIASHQEIRLYILAEHERNSLSVEF